MSNRLVEQVFRHSKSSRTGRAIMVYLAYRADDDGQVWCPVSAICESMSISRNSAFKAMAELEEIGELKRLHKVGKSGVNKYLLDIVHSTKTGTEDSTKSGTVPKAVQYQNWYGDSTKTGTDTVPKLVHNKPISPDKPNKKTKAKKKLPDWFEEFAEMFWQDYPRKEAKKPALEKLKIIIRDSKNPEQTRTEIMQGLGRWKKSKQWTDGFICHATTFLNQARWQDQPEPAKQKAEGYLTNRNYRDPLFDN